VRSNLGLAARTLALDLATGEVTRALNAAGIDSMVLKGPAMAHLLYRDAPGCRNYGDIDLLVAPARFIDAGRVLASLGFKDRLAGIRPSEAARLNGRPWHRDGAAYVAVDLHRGFHHVADRPAWWDVLSAHREVLLIEGQPVAVPDRAGCALVTALHAAEATSTGKPLEDLRRALQVFDDEIWREAASRARLAGACGAFAAALCRQSTGAALAARIGLTLTDPVAWFRATSTRPGANSFGLVLEPGTLAARAQRVRDLALPSRTILAEIRPIARRGPAGRAAARLGRLCLIAVRLPRLLLAWHRASRTVRRRGTPPPALVPARPGRPLRVRTEAVVRTSWWTLRTWWQVHRQLARGSRSAGSQPAGTPPIRMPPAGARPASAGPAGPTMAYSARTARFVLARCRSTCLETALVRQARAAAAGLAIDVVVGVTPPASGFRAHAWLDGDRVEPRFVELWRYPAVPAQPDRPRRAA
jgi:Uncharacterised nucleotidyltransferase/Transglutaminase-like superfamily